MKRQVDSIVAVVTLGVILSCSLIIMAFPEARVTLDITFMEVRRFILFMFLLGKVVIPLGTLLLLVFITTKVYISIKDTRRIHPDESGLFPLIEHKGSVINYNSQQAHLMAVWTRGQAMSGLKPTSSSTKAFTETLQGDWDITKPELKALGPPEKKMRSEPVYRVRSLVKEPTIGIGFDKQDQLVELPLHGMSALLIGGLPGTGKTNALANIIVWVAKQDAEGNQVQICISDVKRMDFGQVPDDLRIMALPKANTLDDSMTLLHTVNQEMHRRNEIISKHGAHHLRQYNSLGSANSLPYIVTIIDELSFFGSQPDFMRLTRETASMGRAAGIVLVLATQKPSANTVDTDLRSMCSASLAFRVKTASDSRIILDCVGAETLSDVPGRALLYDGTLREVQTFNSELQSRFDPYVMTAPKGDTDNGIVEGTYRVIEPEPEVYDKTFWDEFSRNYIAQHPNCNTTHLAKAMAHRRGRPAEFENFRSTAYGYLKLYSANYG